LQRAGGGDASDAVTTPTRRRKVSIDPHTNLCTPLAPSSAAPGAVWDSPGEAGGLAAADDDGGGCELATRAAFAWDSPGEAAALQHSSGGGGKGETHSRGGCSDGGTAMEKKCES
jgi:hypothetical protein